MVKKTSLIFFCLVLLQAIASADSNTMKLSKVLRQIDSVKVDLNKKEKQQVSVKEKLHGLQTKVNVLTKQLTKTTKNLKKQKEVLHKLARDKRLKQSKLQEAKTYLESQINAAYRIEPDNYFKQVLTGTAEKSDILLAYHRYVMQARLSHMHNMGKILNKLEHNRQKINVQAKNLERLEKKQERQKLDLEHAKGEQSKTLKSLKDKIAIQNKKLQDLVRAKKNLERVINRLTSHGSHVISPALKSKFCKNFVWPVQGEIVTHFGSPIEQSTWKWNGVIIDITSYQEVRAISSGKIVYADPLTGYGLFLIVDHGSGYMSLYGYNHSLCKRLNEHVAAGETIATVGKNNNEKAELYFAIRYNGEPINPEKWCQ